MSLIDEDGKRVVEPGIFKIAVGGRQPEIKIPEIKLPAVLTGQMKVIGLPFFRD